VIFAAALGSPAAKKTKSKERKNAFNYDEAAELNDSLQQPKL
jgi:hypothetical protein